ncbi:MULTISPECIES: flagellar protein FlgN [unclassified Yoonia]|uniref:flagellar protein FlgN n=1 Tax=unclassified Yoonia TaxID=2629118 RepID=UPI002AFFAE7D|nr:MULTISPECIES: flagellar protein FlgN [unclassified Yoonia]
MRDPQLTDLLTLLAAEAAAIIAGDYAALDNLAARKTALIDHLPQALAQSQDLRLVADALTQNQALLGAAITGIGAARDRLAALRKVREGLQVYDQSGQFAAPAITRPDLVKKA